MPNSFSKPIKEDRNWTSKTTVYVFFFFTLLYQQHNHPSTTPPTLSSVNNEQVNNFFLSIKQFLQTQTNDLLSFYHVPYQQIAVN